MSLIVTTRTRELELREHRILDQILSIGRDLTEHNRERRRCRTERLAADHLGRETDLATGSQVQHDPKLSTQQRDRLAVEERTTSG